MDRYEVLRYIGEGGFGEALLVRDKRPPGGIFVMKRVDLLRLSTKQRFVYGKGRHAYSLHSLVVKHVIWVNKHHLRGHVIDI